MAMHFSKERVMSKIVKRTEADGGCWTWTGATIHGYGRFLRDGKNIQVHRYIYEETHGPILGGLCVLHKCDNRLCCNPDHLFLGTRAENSRDMIEKGRLVVSLGGRKLTDDQIREIKQIGKTRPYIELSNRYGVSQSQICRIVNGQVWANT